MQAILDAIDAGTLDAHIALVLADRPDAFILERARHRGIATGLIDCRGFRTNSPKRPSGNRRPPERRRRRTRLPGRFPAAGKTADVRCVSQRILNIHPALLPAFPGLESWKQALDAGVAETGGTVHFVDEGMDTGPVILQQRVPVLPGDTPESLHARIQTAEHRLYPAAITRVAAGLRPPV